MVWWLSLYEIIHLFFLLLNERLNVMKWDVKLYVAGKVFIESVHARNRNDAIDTAKSRNPHAKVIGVNPNLRD